MIFDLESKCLEYNRNLESKGYPSERLEMMKQVNVNDKNRKTKKLEKFKGDRTNKMAVSQWLIYNYTGDTDFADFINNHLRRRNVRTSPMHLFCNFMSLQLSNYQDEFESFKKK